MCSWARRDARLYIASESIAHMDIWQSVLRNADLYPWSR